MKPKPLASLNHFTVPVVLTDESPFCAALIGDSNCRVLLLHPVANHEFGQENDLSRWRIPPSWRGAHHSVVVLFLAGGYRERELVLRGRQWAGGEVGEDAGRVVGLVEVDRGALIRTGFRGVEITA